MNSNPMTLVWYSSNSNPPLDWTSNMFSPWKTSWVVCSGGRICFEGRLLWFSINNERREMIQNKSHKHFWNKKIARSQDGRLNSYCRLLTTRTFDPGIVTGPIIMRFLSYGRALWAGRQTKEAHNHAFLSYGPLSHRTLGTFLCSHEMKIKEMCSVTFYFIFENCN